MNSIRGFLLNPNVHGVITALLGVAALVPGPWAGVSAILTPVFAGITTVLPENGSLHRDDYKELAATIADAVGKTLKSTDMQGRS